MYGVVPLKKAKLSLGWWQRLLKQGQTNTKVTTQVMSSPFGVPWGNPSTAFTPQSIWSLESTLIFLQTLQERSSEGSPPAPGVGAGVLWMSLSQVRGSAQPWEGPRVQPPSSSCCRRVLTSKAGAERLLRASALLFLFSNAHKLSTNNLSYQVSEEDWVIMFVVQNEGCQF